MSETDLSRAIRKALAAKGYWVDRINSGNVFLSYTSKRTGKTSGRKIAMAKPGTPDTLVIDPYCWVETKTPIGKASPEQLEWHRQAQKRGVRATFARSIGEALRYVDQCARDDGLRGRIRLCPHDRCPMEDQP
jgi:hypothetical protein